MLQANWPLFCGLLGSAVLGIIAGGIVLLSLLSRQYDEVIRKNVPIVWGLAFFTTLVVAVCSAVPLSVICDCVAGFYRDGFSGGYAMISRTAPGTGVNTLVMILLLPHMFLRMLQWGLSGGRVGTAIPPWPDPKGAHGLITGVELDKDTPIRIDELRFPDLGIAVFGVSLLAQYITTQWYGTETPNWRYTSAMALSFVTFFIWDDYLLFRSIYFDAEGRVPTGPMKWRLRLILGIAAASTVLVWLSGGVWLGLFVTVAIVPGVITIRGLLDALCTPRSHGALCHDNPTYAARVLLGTIRQMDFTDDGKEDATGVRGALEVISQVAVMELSSTLSAAINRWDETKERSEKIDRT